MKKIKRKEITWKEAILNTLPFLEKYFFSVGVSLAVAGTIIYVTNPKWIFWAGAILLLIGAFLYGFNKAT